MACLFTFNVCHQFVDSSISYAAKLYFWHLCSVISVVLTCDKCLNIAVSTVTYGYGTFGQENHSKSSTRLPAWQRLMLTNMPNWLPGLYWYDLTWCICLLSSSLKTTVLWCQYAVVYLGGGPRCDGRRLWPDHENFLQATLCEKVRFLPFSSKNCKIQQCLMVFCVSKFQKNWRICGFH